MFKDYLEYQRFLSDFENKYQVVGATVPPTVAK